MAPRHIAGGVLALFALAWLDGNVTHWSQPVPGAAGAAPVPVAPPVAAGTGDGPWRAPLPLDALAGPLDAKHHDYPAVDIPVPEGTPIAAMHAGTVSYVGGDCGLGIQIDAGDLAIKVCHASRRLKTEGATVAAGDPIALAGSSGNSSGPHAHFEVLAGGVLRCPGSFLSALYADRPVPHPSTLPTAGCVT